MAEDDIVSDMLRLVREQLGDDVLSEDTALAIDKAVRREWGGDRPYIAKVSADEKKRRVESAKRAAREDGVSAASRGEGVSRSSLYRYLKK